jgi:ferredoxin
VRRSADEEIICEILHRRDDGAGSRFPFDPANFSLLAKRSEKPLFLFDVAPWYRGAPALVKDEHGKERCVACQLCEFICPPGAITIVPEEIPPSDPWAKVEKRPKEFDTAHWDDILRLATSIRSGTATASGMLRKLSAYPRQNGLAVALRELGRIERTLFTLDWLKNIDLRRRANAGLNKGEARNALARAIFFYRLGEMRDRSFESQVYRASGLNLLIAAIILWNTRYLEEAFFELEQQGVNVAPTIVTHVAPLGWEHIGLTGDYVWTDAEQPSDGVLRPLRRRESMLAA